MVCLRQRHLLDIQLYGLIIVDFESGPLLDRLQKFCELFLIFTDHCPMYSFFVILSLLLDAIGQYFVQGLVH